MPIPSSHARARSRKKKEPRDKINIVLGPFAVESRYDWLDDATIGNVDLTETRAKIGRLREWAAARIGGG